jgi:hypothetical protein
MLDAKYVIKFAPTEPFCDFLKYCKETYIDFGTSSETNLTTYKVSIQTKKVSLTLGKQID